MKTIIMNKMKAKRIVRFAMQTLMVLFATIAAVAQTQPTDLKPHGTNSSDAVVASENVDSVTVNAAINYFVMPDAAISPSYDYATDPIANLNSSFDWTATNGSPTITDNNAGWVGANNSNYVNIEWGSTGSYQVKVSEIARSGSCSGDTTTIDVNVINAPTAAFNGVSDAVCNASPVTVSYTFTVDLTTDVISNNIRLAIDVDGPSTADIYTTTYDLTEGTVTFDIPAGNFDDGFGDYVVTITEVSDRISRKSGLTIDPAQSFTLTINPLPSTGTIYHLPNN